MTFVADTPYRARPNRPKPPQKQGPFIGMRDNVDPSTSRSNLARQILNCYPVQADQGAALLGRPGIKKIGAQAGSAGARAGQLVGIFEKTDGTKYHFKVVAGEIYTLDVSTGVYTKVVTQANLTTSSAPLSTTATIYFVALADKAILSDGVNKPVAWTGGTGAAAVSEVTNCPVLFGPPTLYYAKLVGIKNSDRKTIVWSEENDPLTGYEAGGYNNAWDLVQTSTSPLTAVLGSNEYLYVFRANSILAVVGASGSSFRTSGTRDGVSDTLGTTAPGSVLFLNRKVYFQDAEGNPCVIVPGGGAIEIGADFRATLSALSPAAADLAKTRAFYDPQIKLVGFARIESGQTVPTTCLMYDPRPETPQAVALFTGWTVQAVGPGTSTGGRDILMHLDSSGYAYEHGHPDGTVWDDELGSGTVPVAHVVESGEAYYEMELEQYFSQLTLILRIGTDLSGLGIRTTTPYGVGENVAATLTGTFSRWDTSEWDAFAWASDASEQRLVMGLYDQGRWLRWRLQHSALGEQFGLVQALVTAQPMDLSPFSA